jgi:hypothetical protein
MTPDDPNKNNPTYESDYGTGKELWAFIPGSVLSKLKNNLLKGEEQAAVDASPTVTDIYDDSATDKWRTVVLSALGGGGDSVFCLDVTDPEKPTFMWEFSDLNLIRSSSSPSVGVVGHKRDSSGNPTWAAFFASGVVDSTEQPSIFVLDMTTGLPLQLSGAESTYPYRIILNDTADRGAVISGQPVVVDTDFNGLADRLYVGTTHGNVYKVDIPEDSTGSVCQAVINTDFDYTEDDGTSHSITATQDKGNAIYDSPAVVADPIEKEVHILFGTGDSPYADDNLDYSVNTAPKYHFFAYVDSGDKGTCSSGDVELAWFYELLSGEKVWASAFAAANQVYFGTTTAETQDPCSVASDGADPDGGGIYAMDIETGGKLSEVKTEVHQDIQLTPVVHDQHILAKDPEGEVHVIGEGEFNNEINSRGSGTSDVLLWREVNSY